MATSIRRPRCGKLIYMLLVVLPGGVAAAARVAARWLLRSDRYGSDGIDAPVGTAATVIDAPVVRIGGGSGPTAGFSNTLYGPTIGGRRLGITRAREAACVDCARCAMARGALANPSESRLLASSRSDKCN